MKKSWQIWLGVLALMIFIYATRAILLPFIVGLGVAYLLDPLADRLEARKVPRWLAAASLLVLFFILASAVLVAIFSVIENANDRLYPEFTRLHCRRAPAGR